MELRKVSLTDERRCVEALLFSKQVLSEVSEIINPNYFRNNKHKDIIVWTKYFFEQYQDAPKEQIIDFLCEVKPEEREHYLDILTPILERNIGTKTNDEYLQDRVIEFFKKRELEIISGNVQYLISKNKIQEAEAELLSFNKPSKITVQSFNPLDDADEIFRYREEGLFKFNGDLGKFVGELQRGWFVAVSGAFKKGKSFLLQEFMFQAMFSRLKVGFVSLEMSRVSMKERLYKRALALAEAQGLYKVPVFDCLSNQNGKCTYPTRVGKGAILVNGKRQPQHIVQKHKVCTSCMGSDDFIPTSWYEEIYKNEFEAYSVINSINSIKKMYHQYVQMRCFPRFSASVKDIKHEINIWNEKLNFYPDVIVIDYADILKPDSKTAGFEKEDEIWMELAQLASELNCLVITATQLTRSGLNVETQSEEHISKWIGKLAHVDVWIALNQTDDEKENNIMRIGIMEHRHKNFNKQDCCYVLQDIGIGQVNLGSYFKEFK